MSADEHTARPTLVVGVDGSEGSHRAVEWAARFAGQAGYEVVAVHVLTYDHELLEDITPDTMRNWRDEVTAQLHTEWTRPLADVPHRNMVVEAGSAAKGLLAVTGDESADLLVVGAHGRTGLVGRVLGGAAYKVIHHAEVPVVVVPAE